MKESTHKRLTRFLNILKDWSVYFPHDFRAVEMINEMKTIKEKCLFVDPFLTDLFDDILGYLARKVDFFVRFKIQLIFEIKIKKTFRSKS